MPTIVDGLLAPEREGAGKFCHDITANKRRIRRKHPRILVVACCLFSQSTEATREHAINPDPLQDPHPLHNHRYYDIIRKENADRIKRRGTIDVLRNQFSRPPITSTQSILPENNFSELGLCHLNALGRYSSLEKNITTGQWIAKKTGSNIYGDSAAAMLAVHHFNHGIDDVVDELRNINQRCNVRLTIEFADSFSSKPKSVEQITTANARDGTQESGPQPCAVLGAYRSAVSTAVGIITGVYELPHISPYSTSPDLDNQDLYPTFTRTVPSDAGASLLTLQFLQRWQVTHVGVLYVNDAYGSAYQKAFTALAETKGITVVSYSIDFRPTESEISDAVQGLASTGYNYFFCIIFGPEHYDLIMTEAYHQGIAGNPDRPTNWIFGDATESYLRGVKYPQGSPLALATQGTGVVLADSRHQGMPGYDRFLKVWRSLDDDDVDFFNSKQPTGDLDYFQAPSDYFRTNDPSSVSLFSYDAVVALGLGACQVASNTSSSYFNGKDHFDEVVKSNFGGASGRVRFDSETTSRDPTSALHLVHNLVARESDDEGMITFKMEPSAAYVPGGSMGEGSWKDIDGKTYIFSDGSSTPPEPLAPYTKNMNYIGWPLRAVGLTMSATAIFLSIAFAVWTFVNRGDHIVRASQPFFLIFICAGTAIIGSAIIPLSFDDEIASVQGASIACMAVPWLSSVGYVLAFSALFSKTWRINMIFNHKEMKRITVQPRHVLAPLIGLSTLNLATLLVWTFVGPLTWVRFDATSVDRFGRVTSSMGWCTSDGQRALPFIVVLFVINISVLLVACLQSYRARHISTEFSESSYVGMAIASMLQAAFLGVPLMVIVRGQTQPSYFVATCLIFITSMSVLLLIFVPKVRCMRLKKRRRKLGKLKYHDTKYGRGGKRRSIVALTQKIRAAVLMEMMQNGHEAFRFAPDSRQDANFQTMDAQQGSAEGAQMEGSECSPVDNNGATTTRTETPPQSPLDESQNESRCSEPDELTLAESDGGCQPGIRVEWSPLVYENKDLRKEVATLHREKRALTQRMSVLLLRRDQEGAAGIGDAVSKSFAGGCITPIEAINDIGEEEFPKKRWSILSGLG